MACAVSRRISEAEDEACHRNVFIELGPVYPSARGADLESGSFSRGRMGEPREVAKRDTKKAAVAKPNPEELIVAPCLQGGWLSYRSTHSTVPRSILPRPAPYFRPPATRLC